MQAAGLWGKLLEGLVQLLEHADAEGGTAGGGGAGGGDDLDVEEYSGYTAAYARLHNAHRYAAVGQLAL